MTIEEMKTRKIELGLTGEMIAEASGVPLGTVQKIFSGATKAPRKATIDALEKVLGSAPEPEKASYYEKRMERPAGAVREPAWHYNAAEKSGRYTVEDYDSLPEDQRMELIDGEFYDMGAPSMRHQRILSLLFLLFEECIEEHGSPCEVFFAPCEVRLNKDSYTMVQPDLMVICGDYDRRAARYEGAPELIVEIVSDSTRARDLFLKLYKYQDAGVREYWTVDPKRQVVMVHFFEDEEYEPKKYDFRSQIPVSISGGACRIDFSRILDKMKGYFD